MKKSKIIKLLSVLMGLCLAGPSLGETALTEVKLIEMARISSIAKASGAVAVSQTGLLDDRNQEQYTPQFFATGAYGETDRKQANQFQPVMTPTKNFSVGVRKKLPLGMTTELSAFGNQFSSDDGKIDRATTMGAKLTLRTDLLKNIMGKNDKETDASFKFTSEKQKLKNKIDQRRFETQVRKIYWGLMANREAVKISEGLIKLAQKQLKEAKNRQNLAVAEEGEIARYNSQLSQTRTNVILLNYQYQSLLISLRALVPELTDQELSFPMDDLKTITMKVIECTELIKKQQSIPWDFTKADEVIRLAEQSAEADAKVVRTHDGADLNLLTEFEYTGVDKGFDESASRFADDGRFGYVVGLEFSMPLGEGSKNSRSSQLALRANQLSLEKQQITNGLKARHAQMAQLIDLLYETSRLQGDSSSNLELVAKDSENKYDQARVNVDQIIRDQNALQVSLLDRLNTRSTVMSELLDYFADFTETPCQLNQL